MLHFYPYNYQNSQYTGTPGLPDTVSYFFVPQEKEDVFIRHECPNANLLGYVIGFSIIGGVIRVVQATKVFFKEFSQVDWKQENDPHRQELWNAGKNFFRGGVEICPFTGVFLFLYDLFRSRVFIQSDILNEIEKGGDSIQGKAGIAFEGKIIFLIDLNAIDPSPKKQITFLWSELHKAMEDESKELLDLNKRVRKEALEKGNEEYQWKENTLSLKDLIRKKFPGIDVV